jgi:hypothetical protein
MKLIVMDPAAALFGPGDVLEAEMIPSAATGRAILVIDRHGNDASYLTPSEAVREGLGIQDATDRELAMLRAAGYPLPVAPPGAKG